MAEVYVNIPQLIALTGTKRLTVDGDSLPEVLVSLEKGFPGFKHNLLDCEGRFLGHVMVIGRYTNRSEKEIVNDPGDSRGGIQELAILPVTCGG